METYQRSISVAAWMWNNICTGLEGVWEITQMQIMHLQFKLLQELATHIYFHCWYDENVIYNICATLQPFPRARLQLRRASGKIWLNNHWFFIKFTFFCFEIVSGINYDEFWKIVIFWPCHQKMIFLTWFLSDPSLPVAQLSSYSANSKL